jgi:hypothetical protein
MAKSHVLVEDFGMKRRPSRFLAQQLEGQLNSLLPPGVPDPGGERYTSWFHGWSQLIDGCMINDWG